MYGLLIDHVCVFNAPILLLKDRTIPSTSPAYAGKKKAQASSALKGRGGAAVRGGRGSRPVRANGAQRNGRCVCLCILVCFCVCIYVSIMSILCMHINLSTCVHAYVCVCVYKPFVSLKYRLVVCSFTHSLHPSPPVPPPSPPTSTSLPFHFHLPPFSPAQRRSKNRSVKVASPDPRLSLPPPTTLEELLKRQWEETVSFLTQETAKQNNGVCVCVCACVCACVHACICACLVFHTVMYWPRRPTDHLSTAKV